MGYVDQVAFSRRSCPVITPTEYVYGRQVDAAEGHEDPLFVLPEGWEGMTEQQVTDWSIRYLVEHGMVATPSLPSGQASPRGSWDDPFPVYEWDVPAGFTSLTYLDPVPLVRQAGDGAFGGGRSGKPGLYKNDELAAGRVVYHEDEPVVAEIPAVAWDAYPSSWDIPVESMLSRLPLEKPRLDRAGMREEMWARVDAEVAAWQALGKKG